MTGLILAMLVFGAPVSNNAAAKQAFDAVAEQRDQCNAITLDDAKTLATNLKKRIVALEELHRATINPARDLIRGPRAGHARRVGKGVEPLAASLRAARTVLANRDLGRMQLSWAGSMAGEFLALVALGVYAYDAGKEGQIAEGIKVNGVDVGGMSSSQARRYPASSPT